MSTAPERFAFGENWCRFLRVLEERHVVEAARSLQTMLRVDNLAQKSFLDAGCGSGLFSLAALHLGARSVLSFDRDPQSVACAQELRRRFGVSPAKWKITAGDVIDTTYMESLGTWDVVYCWGVLHHTGAMWRGLSTIGGRVAPGGYLFLAIYNDQGLRSRLWRKIKRNYNSLPEITRTPYAIGVMLPRELLSLGASALRLNLGQYFRSWSPKSQRERGMNRWHDLIDWVGGYPFEVARPEEIFDCFRGRGFNLISLRTCGGGLGCNQFVFQAPHTEAAPAQDALAT